MELWKRTLSKTTVTSLKLSSHFLKVLLSGTFGRENFKHECYLPLAFLDTSYDDPYHVDVKRLKAIKVESEEIAIYIAEVAHWKTVDKKEFEEIIKSFELRDEVDDFWKDKKDYESTPQSAELMANNVD